MQRGITQRQLAANAGLQVWPLHRIERDVMRPNSDEVAAIERALGIEKLEMGAESQQ